MKYVLSAIAALLVVCVTVFCRSEASLANDQTKLVSNFYQHVLSLDVRGVPSRDTIETLSPFMSSKLRNALLQALADEEAHTRETKGDEPPLFEGAIFLGVWEGAKQVLDVQHENKSQLSSYLVTFQMEAPYDQDPKHNWTDRVILVQENEKWVVDDVWFQVGGDSSAPMNLKQRLQH